MPRVDLTDNELLLLDGRVSAEVQAQVDLARARVETRQRFRHLSAAQAGFLADVVSEATASQHLRFKSASLMSCGVCGSALGYEKFTRGPRRGENDPTRPRRIEGVELTNGSLLLSSLRACRGCITALLPALRTALADVRAELPEELRVPGAKRYRRVPRRACKRCGWEGPETDMVPSKVLPWRACPHCEQPDVLGTTNIIYLHTHDLIEVAP